MSSHTHSAPANCLLIAAVPLPARSRWTCWPRSVFLHACRRMSVCCLTLSSAKWTDTCARDSRAACCRYSSRVACLGQMVHACFKPCLQLKADLACAFPHSLQCFFRGFTIVGFIAYQTKNWSKLSLTSVARVCCVPTLRTSFRPWPCHLLRSPLLAHTTMYTSSTAWCVGLSTGLCCGRVVFRCSGERVCE